MSPQVLSNAVILITGAGKGIGEALVLELLERKDRFPGLKLFLTSRTESDLAKLQNIVVEAGISCEYLAADLSNNPTSALDACLKKFGRLDVLLHSAGVGRFGDFLSLTKDDLIFTMKTNVEASFLLLQKSYAQMKSQIKNDNIRGQIQWITSVAAERSFEQSAIYCMSKYAQRGLIDVMRLYGYKDGIRILEVKPGATLTPMWGNDVTPEMITKMMTARDIAHPMVDALLLPPTASIEVLTVRPVGGDL